MDDEQFDDGDAEESLDEREAWLVAQDLDDLDAFERVFGDDGTKGVSLWCHDCDEEHYYPWDLLRNSLELLLRTGEIPVHEPAFNPDPEEYVPWEYARGYVDALRDVGATQTLEVTGCPRCQLPLDDQLGVAAFCPRCGTALLRQRLVLALTAAGLDDDACSQVLRRSGLPG